jgi:hypothetical protein
MVKLNTELKLVALLQHAQTEMNKIYRYGEHSPPSYGGCTQDALFNSGDVPTETGTGIFITEVQRLEMMWKQQLAGVGAGPPPPCVPGRGLIASLPLRILTGPLEMISALCAAGSAIPRRRAIRQLNLTERLTEKWWANMGANAATLRLSVKNKTIKR